MFEITGLGDMSDYENQDDQGYETYQTNPYHGSQQQQQQGEEVKAKKMSLYDRLDSQWLALVELGFTLSALSGSCGVICFMRVFGAGLLAFSMALIAAISGLILLFVFWKEVSNSEYKLRLCLMLAALTAGLAISSSDMVVDTTRHYWAIISGVSIATGASSLVVFALIIASRFNYQQD